MPHRIECMIADDIAEFEAKIDPRFREHDAEIARLRMRLDEAIALIDELRSEFKSHLFDHECREYLEAE